MGFVIVTCVLIILGLMCNQRIPTKARALEPLIKEFTDFKMRTGNYPTNVLALQTAQLIANKYSMYLGERTATNLMWDAFTVSSHDLTVLVESNYFTLFAPTGRIWPISFSSFPVWRFESDGAKWIKGRIHWSLLGTYRDED